MAQRELHEGLGIDWDATRRMAEINAAYQALRSRATGGAGTPARDAGAAGGSGPAGRAPGAARPSGPPPPPPTRPVTARLDTTDLFRQRNATTTPAGGGYRHRPRAPAAHRRATWGEAEEPRASDPTGPLQRVRSRRASRRPLPEIGAALATRIVFGKFHGRTLGEIVAQEPTYLQWVERTITRDPDLVAARPPRAELRPAAGRPRPAGPMPRAPREGTRTGTLIGVHAKRRREDPRESPRPDKSAATVADRACGPEIRGYSTRARSPRGHQMTLPAASSKVGVSRRSGPWPTPQGCPGGSRRRLHQEDTHVAGTRLCDVRPVSGRERSVACMHRPMTDVPGRCPHRRGCPHCGPDHPACHAPRGLARRRMGVWPGTLLACFEQSAGAASSWWPRPWSLPRAAARRLRHRSTPQRRAAASTGRR